MLSRRGLITGLVSLIAAPAIVRAASLDVVRGVKLDLMATEWDGAYREIVLGYRITREVIERQALEWGFTREQLVQLKTEGTSIVYDHLDAASVWCDPDWRL